MNVQTTGESNLPRRTFLKTTALATIGAAAIGTAVAQSPAPTNRRKIKLGLDNFSVRAMGWKATALIDYAASLKTDSLFISDLDAF